MFEALYWWFYWYYSLPNGIMSSFECVLSTYFALSSGRCPYFQCKLTMHSTWRVALYKVFNLKRISDLCYVQYCMGVLPSWLTWGIRTLNFLQKQSVFHHMPIRTTSTLFVLFRTKVYGFLCHNNFALWSVLQMCATCIFKPFIHELTLFSRVHASSY